MGALELLVIACWVLFIVVWLIGAFYNAGHGPRTRFFSVRPGQRLFAIVVLLILFHLLPSDVWRPLEVHLMWLRAVGAVVLVLATALAVWARVALGTMWSPAPALKEDHELRRDGPYALVRHPIYTALLGMVLATACFAGFGRWLIVLAFVVVWLAQRVRIEERLMEETFPDEYPRYRRQVPALWPWPRPRQSVVE